MGYGMLHDFGQAIMISYKRVPDCALLVVPLGLSFPLKSPRVGWDMGPYQDHVGVRVSLLRGTTQDPIIPETRQGLD